MKKNSNKTSKLIASILAVAMIAIMAGCGGGGNTGNANAGNASSAANNQGGSVAQAASQAAAKPATQSAAKPSSSLSTDEREKIENKEKYKAYAESLKANPVNCSAYDFTFTVEGIEQAIDYYKNYGGSQEVDERKSFVGLSILSDVFTNPNDKRITIYFTKNYADITDMMNKYFESKDGQEQLKSWGDGAEKMKNKVINMINNVAKAEGSNIWFIRVPSNATYEFLVYFENGNAFRSDSATSFRGLFALYNKSTEETRKKERIQYFADDNGNIDLKNFG